MKRMSFLAIAPIDSPFPSRSASIPAEFRPLHKYLDGRYASTVVLTFTQMEELIGRALPDAALERDDWWANVEGGVEPSPQSRCWAQAGRTATPHLRAGTVAFERPVV